jgi:hypothetical protein
MTERRAHAPSLIKDDKMIILGGYSDRTGRNVDTVEEYSILGGIWRRVHDYKLPEPTSKHCALIVGTYTSLYYREKHANLLKHARTLYRVARTLHIATLKSSQ